jgi:ABC-2 type transport system permease protein
VPAFTSVIETVRGLLAGSSIAATTVWTAVAWCLALTLLGWLWARAAYRRPRV